MGVDALKAPAEGRQGWLSDDRAGKLVIFIST